MSLPHIAENPDKTNLSGIILLRRYQNKQEYIDAIYKLLGERVDFQRYLKENNLNSGINAYTTNEKTAHIGNYAFAHNHVFFGDIDLDTIQKGKPFESFKKKILDIPQDGYLSQLFPGAPMRQVEVLLLPENNPHFPPGNAITLERRNIFLNTADISDMEILENELTPVFLEQLGLLRGLNSDTLLAIPEYGTMTIRQGRELLSDIVSTYRYRKSGKSIGDNPIAVDHLRIGLTYYIKGNLGDLVPTVYDPYKKGYEFSRFLFTKLILNNTPASSEKEFQEILSVASEVYAQNPTPPHEIKRLNQTIDSYTQRRLHYIRENPDVEEKIWDGLDQFGKKFVAILYDIQKKNRIQEVFENKK